MEESTNEGRRRAARAYHERQKDKDENAVVEKYYVIQGEKMDKIVEKIKMKNGSIYTKFIGMKHHLKEWMKKNKIVTESEDRFKRMGGV